MSNKLAGVDVLLKVNTGTVALPTYTVVGGQSGATLNRSTNLIEVTSKDANGWAESVAGIKNWSIECEGFMVVSDTALDYLETAWLNGDTILVEIAVGSKVYSGTALIEDYPQEFPQDDAVSFSLSLTGTGALAITTGA